MGSRISYVKQMAELVPAWLPYRIGWAYLPGVGQIACGLGVFSIFSRVAATAEAAMISLFTHLVWGPAILAATKAGYHGRRSSYHGRSSLGHGL